jgi:ABC-type proline/glycine betaine transport system substrate-binding protein
MKRRGLIAALAGSAVLALGLAACLAPWRERQVRLAIIDWPAYEYFYLASRKGLDR